MNTDAPITAGRWATGLLGVVLALAGGAAAQGPGGTLAGTVQDDSGAVLPGVTVTVTSADTGRSRSVVTDSRGEYRMVGLAAGDYTVQGILPGFRTEARAVAVGAGALTHDIVLGLAPLAETVTVTRTDQALGLVPSLVTVVQRDAIEVGQRCASLDEALRGIPGLFVQNRRNYGLSGGIGLSIRAPEPRFGLRGLAILQDSIPITTADGTTEPGSVDLGSVGRIDVIRGPSAVLYGNSAGGVINLETTFDTSRRLTLAPDIQFGSHGYNRQQLRVDGGNTGTQFMGSISRFETDGFRQNSHAEITQANFVVRRELTADTESAASSTCTTRPSPRARASSTARTRARRRCAARTATASPAPAWPATSRLAAVGVKEPARVRGASRWSTASATRSASAPPAGACGATSTPSAPSATSSWAAPGSGSAPSTWGPPRPVR